MILVSALAFAGATCLSPVDAGEDSSTQQDAYAKRSVEIVALAAAKADLRLAKLIAPDAKFSLGAGDVGRPLGSGVDGAHAIALALEAGTFAYNGWDYMHMPRDACGPLDVEVEFISSDGASAARVKFHYDGGLLQTASGWQRSRVSGQVRAETR